MQCDELCSSSRNACLLCRATKAVAAIAVNEGVSPAHAQISQAVLRALGLEPHRRIALTKTASAAPVALPAVVVLYPVLPSSSEPLLPELSESVQREEELSLDELQQLFPAWLIAQAAGGASSSQQQNGEDAADVKEEQGGVVPLQDGTLMCLEHATTQRQSTYLLELQWPPGARKHRGAVQMSASAFLSANIRLDMGKAVELPSLQPMTLSKAQQSAAGVDLPSGGFGEKWFQEFGTKALARLLPLLHDTSRRLLCGAGVPPPGGLLVCGPAGSGGWHSVASFLVLALHSSQESAAVQPLREDYFRKSLIVILCGRCLSWQDDEEVCSKDAATLCREDCPCEEVRSCSGSASALPHTCGVGRLQKG